MDSKLVSAIVVIAILLILFALMALAWRRRGRAQSDLPELDAVPADLGTALGSFAGLYLSTTPAGAPLERITVRGLGFRARTSVELFESGIVFNTDRFIARESIVAIERATWTIDRGVETDGLSVVRWALGERELESNFRLDEPELFRTAALGLVKSGKK